MRSEDTALRLAGLIGLGVLIWLVYLSWTFYLERTAISDAAWFSWLMIDTGLPQSFLGRYGSFLSELVPVGLIYADAPLETVLRTYSLCLIGIHVVLFWFVVVRFRDVRGAILLPLTLVTGLHFMFYYGTSELNQGLSFTALVWVLLRKTMDAEGKQERRRWGIIVFLVSVWTSFYHQVLVLPLLFLIGLEFIARARWRDKWSWLLAAALVGWYVVRIKLLATSAYEQERMPGAGDLLGLLPELSDLRSTEYLMSVFPKFKAFWLMLLAVLTGLVLTRKWLLAAWTGFFSGALLVVVLITDRDIGSPVMFENFYPLIALCWAATFAEVFVTWRPSWPKTSFATLGLVSLVGCVQVYRGHFIVSAKVDYLARVTGYLRSNGLQKGFINEGNFPWPYSIGLWPLAFESSLISGVQGPKEVATVFCGSDDMKLDTMYHHGNAFLGPNWLPLWFTSDHLNPAYFRFHHAGFYRLNTSMPDSIMRAFRPEDVHIVPEEATMRMVPDRFSVVHVVVENLSDRRFCSLDANGEPLRFRYRLFDENGVLYAEHAQRTALEADVPAHSSYEQGLIIERPERSGRYHVAVELVVGESTSLGLGTTFWIETSRF